MFNDDAGFELVNLQAQRDLNSLVKNDETRTVNRDRTTTIDKDETVTVHGNRTETVHKSEHVRIKGNRDKTVNGNDSLIVNKDRKETINKSRSLNVDKTNTEFVKLGKSVTVGLGYATQVGTIMNTAVGIMQTEQVGRIKKTFVGKSYSITAGDEFKITVGKSSLVMNADGSIIITGSTIVTQAEKENKVIGKDVLINPPGASAGGSQADEPSSGSVSDASNIPGIVGGGFGGGLKGQPAQRGPDGLPEALAALQQGPMDRAGSFGRVDDNEADGSLIAGNTHSNEPNEGGGGIDADLTKPIYSEKALSDAEKRVYSDRKTTSNKKSKPKVADSRGSSGETAEEYRKRVGGSVSKASEIIASTGDFIEDAAPMNPTKLGKWGSGAAKVVGNKMKDDIKESDKGILEATGEVISDTFDDATKKARELANWWKTDLNPNYPKKDNDD